MSRENPTSADALRWVAHDPDRLAKVRAQLGLSRADAEARGACAPNPYQGTGTGKRSKYGNRPGIVDGIPFDSQKEIGHYGALCLCEKAGTVRWFVPRKELPRKPVYVIEGGTYEPDFVVFYADGRMEVQDVKSPATRREKGYRRSRAQMKERYGIEIVEV